MQFWILDENFESKVQKCPVLRDERWVRDCHLRDTVTALENQSGYEPLKLKNVSLLNSDNFDATDLRS